MPLSNFQRDIFRLLADHRNPESCVAGSTPLHRDGPRFSEDIDIFHPREEAVAKAALGDAALLASADGAVNGGLLPKPLDRISSYVEHAGQLLGHWPSSSEIYSAMLHGDAEGS